MSFLSNNVVTESKQRGKKIVVHALGGVGKTHFGIEACKANNGILVLGEDGIGDPNNIKGISRVDVEEWDHINPDDPKNKVSLKQVIKSLMLEKHDYKTVVIDTYDSLMEAMDKYVVNKFYGGDSSKADAYKQKFSNYVRENNSILKGFDYLTSKKNMDVILLVHTVVNNHRDPASEAWKRWELNLPGGDKTNLASAVYDWADVVLYATRDVEVENKKGTGGERVAYTEWSPAFDAKNRFNLPDKIPFGYHELYKLFNRKDK